MDSKFTKSSYEVNDIFKWCQTFMTNNFVKDREKVRLIFGLLIINLKECKFVKY